MAAAPVMPANLTAAEMKDWIESNQAPQAHLGEIPTPVEETEEVVIDPETGEPFTPPDGEEQPRDAQGRFVARGGEEDDPVLVRDEIDLGDGSGVQVFEGIGSTIEEARTDQVAKLLEAQKNATRKIRELAAKPAQPAPEKVLTPDEEMALSQQLLANPSKVLKDIQEKAKREAVEEVQRQQEAAQRAAAEAHEAAVTFVQNNPDFYPCPENQERIERYIKIYQLPQTLDGINQAYAAVKDILKTKPAAQPTAPAARSSAISTRRSPAVPPKPTGFDEAAYARFCEENGYDPVTFKPADQNAPFGRTASGVRKKF